MSDAPADDRLLDDPVFSAPWQAQAFAMAVKLAEAGHFTWGEWTETIAAEIARAQAAGDPDRGDTYYMHWLAALETLVARKGLAGAEELARRKDAWAEAAAATPHGEPIVLARTAAAQAGASGPGAGPLTPAGE